MIIEVDILRASSRLVKAAAQARVDDELAAESELTLCLQREEPMIAMAQNRIMIIGGDNSSDLYGASLAQALKEIIPILPCSVLVEH